MDAVIGPIVLGFLIFVIGFFNMKGDISTVHWYHRKRITEENKLSFGKIIGLGTIICGISIIIFGCLNFVAEKTQTEWFITIGSVIAIIGVIVGIFISFYAIIKYNKSIF